MKTDVNKIDSQEAQVAPVVKRDNSKIYFFVIAIAALLATNIYFYVKYKSSGEKLYTVTLQKENLQIEIDRIEAELDNIKSEGISSTAALVSAEQSARQKIEELRKGLENNEISGPQIETAKLEVSQLKDQVSKMKDDVTALKIKNQLLAETNSQLDKQVKESEIKTNHLISERNELTDKIAKASSIKVSNVHINGIEEKRNGSLENENKAKRIDRLQIDFTIADNPLASMGKKEIYVRIINPKGNLIANSEDLFLVHGEKLQYTFKESIEFNNNGQEYQFMWSDPNHKFQKGAYTILLYADDAIMGRSSVVLK
ncbi:hypothetical protein PZ892_14610 [Sphingobacterium sp. WM]|uniref:hypothetical protein n=1 Tax=Sphingobacterium TaxID=28453 RepID=UPI000B93F014|nr:hypothetical protein [Sphingobacterium sp. WM]OYD41331.1 hypothetical protein CHT99_14200 [Sphingobacterium cellulitidis]WFB62899.1 hypothetical protein PZ892_14610 [Sphingobacterium sp. WM]